MMEGRKVLTFTINNVLTFRTISINFLNKINIVLKGMLEAKGRQEIDGDALLQSSILPHHPHKGAQNFLRMYLFLVAPMTLLHVLASLCSPERKGEPTYEPSPVVHFREIIIL